jgi:tellurite methyltransferase
VVSIGLLMFFDCPTALRVLSMLQDRVCPGGIAVVNVFIEGTTYLDILQPDSHCLFPREEMARRFSGWDILHSEFRDFDAPGQRTKSFVTLIAQKPGRDSP